VSCADWPLIRLRIQDHPEVQVTRKAHGNAHQKEALIVTIKDSLKRQTLRSNE
jgi:hypothetical protein